MKKGFMIHNVAKRTIALLIIVSMAITGTGMMDSSAFNGVLSGNGTLSGDGILSGDSELSGDAKKYRNIYEGEKLSKGTGVGGVRITKAERMLDIIKETADGAVYFEKCICNHDPEKKLIEAKGYLLEDYTINTENYSQHNLNDFYYSIKKK